MNNRIKKRLRRAMASNKLTNSLMVAFQNFRRKFYYKRVSPYIEIDQHLVMFESFLGKQYACSPRAIYEAMLSDHRFDDYTFVWSFRAPDKMRKELGNDRTIVVKYGSRRYYRMFARAKYWVTNWRLPSFIEKKEGQVCIQTWHGTPLKKIGMDLTIEGNATTSQKKGHALYFNDAKNYDYFVSPSRFCTEVFSSAFGLNQLGKTDILIETGYPRNDRLFTYTQDECLAIRERLQIPTGKRIILYAPTWRDNQYTQGVGYSFELDREVEGFLSNVPSDTIVLLRLHYLVASSLDISRFGDSVIDVSSYEDINDLYLISDALITDYSSVFFDYADLRRPMLFFMYDLDEYQGSIRDFYIDIAELPGPICRTGSELLSSLFNLDEIVEENATKMSSFLEKFNYLDDAFSGRRVAERCFDWSDNA